MIQYQAIVENISNVIQENVNLKWNISGGLGIVEQTIRDTSVTSNIDTLSLGNIAVGQKVVVDLTVTEEEMMDSFADINIYAQLLQGDKIYTSNNLAEAITSKFNVDIEMTTNREGEFLRPGEEIDYNITLTNNNESGTSVYVYDELPIELTVNEIYVNGESQEVINSNIVELLDVNIEGKNTTTIEIKAVINQIEGKDETVQINNVASVYVNGVEKRTTEVSHFIEYEVIQGTENVDVTLATNNEGQYIRPGDEVIYTITVTNNNTVERDAYLLDQIPNELSVQEVLVNGQSQELGEQRNTVEVLNMQLGTEENNQTVVEIRATVRDNISSFEAVRISNTASLFIEGDEKVTNEVNHIIDYQQEDEETDVDIDLEANRIGEYLAPGDEINYQIILTNNNSTDRVVSVRDEIPLQLDVTEVLLNGETLDLDITDNVVEIHDIELDTQDNKQAVIEIRTVVKDGSAEMCFIWPRLHRLPGMRNV